MPANLATFEDGRYRMAAWGRIPVWHGEGQRSDELMDIQQARELGGLGYEVGCYPNRFEVEGGKLVEGLGVQIVRNDTLEPLGYASTEYAPIQNDQMLGLIQPFIKSGDIKGIMTCGVLGKGERSWCQAVVGDFGVDNVDRGLSTLLLLNSFNTTEALKVGFAATYVVCGNTYAMANREFERTGNVLSVMHTGDVESRMKQVELSLDMANKRIRTHEDIAKLLTDVKDVSPAELWRYAIASIPPSKTAIETGKEKGRIDNYWRNQWEAVMSEWYRAPGMDLPTRRDTAFGAWNAITGFVDYGRTPNATEAQRTRSALFGSGRDIKDAALDIAAQHWLQGNEWSEEVQIVDNLCPLG